MGKKKDEDDLLDRWESAYASGASRKQFAKSEEITPKALDNRLYRAKKRRGAAEKEISHTVNDILDGNYRFLLANTKRIKSIDDLLEACKVDLAVWQIDDRYETGTWEMGRRAEHKNIRWEGGKIVDGQSEDTGKLWIETLYRFRVVLVRKKPLPISPLVQPVRFEMPVTADAIPMIPASGRVLIVPDSQMGYRRDFQSGKLTPFHDRAAHDIILQIADHDHFDAVTYLGDGIDFSEWSDKFVSEPEFYYTTQPALIEFAWFLQAMKGILPSARHSMILGNHEDRIIQMMRKHLYAACQLKPVTDVKTDEPYSIRNLLGLDEMEIEISDNYPNGEIWHGEYLRCIHNDGISSAPGGTASKMVKVITKTTLAGHNHRLEMATKTIDDYDGRRYVTAATCGCLCHLDYRVPGHKKGQNWQQGFAVAHFGGPSPAIELIPIIDNQAVYHGKLFVGGDYTEDLARHTQWAF